jgi:hypothetical protein
MSWFSGKQGSDEWFAPSLHSACGLWASANRFNTFGVLRDGKDGRIHVHGSVLSIPWIDLAQPVASVNAG